MSGAKQSSEEIEADIARQRDALASTVSELRYRLDVKARGREKVAELSARPPVRIGAAVAVAVVVALVVWRRRSKH
jgi:MYXO-CTERM domain-containing protein